MKEELEKTPLDSEIPQGLLAFVTLWRLIKPEREGNVWRGDGACYEDARKLLEDILSSGGAGHWGIASCLVDKTPLGLPEGPKCLPSEGEHISLSFRLAESCPVFEDTKDLISRNQDVLSQGKFPSSLYLISDNWYSGNPAEKSEEPVAVVKLRQLCDIIRGLRELADHSYEDSTGQGYSLFLPHKPSKERVLLKTQVDLGLLTFTTTESQAAKLQKLQSLLDGLLEGAEGTHFLEKRMILNETICEFMAGDNSLKKLIEDSEQLVQIYKGNLGAYLDNFSYAKIRQKVADAQLDFVGKASTLVGDMATKIVGFPILSGIVLLLLRLYPRFAVQPATSRNSLPAEPSLNLLAGAWELNSTFVLAGVIAVTMTAVLLLFIYQQWRNVGLILKSKESMFERLKRESRQECAGMQDFKTADKITQDASKEINGSIFRLRIMLIIYAVLAITPLAFVWIVFCS